MCPDLILTKIANAYIDSTFYVFLPGPILIATFINSFTATTMFSRNYYYPYFNMKKLAQRGYLTSQDH